MSFVKEREPKLRDDPSLPSELRADFAAYGNVAPSARAHDALFASLEQALTATPVDSSRWSRLRVWLVGLTLLGVMVAGLSSGAEPRAVQVTPRVQTSLKTSATPPVPPSVVTPRVPPPLDVSPNEPSSAEPGSATRPVARPRVEGRAQLAVVRDPSAELALLTRAKRVLPSDASAALALTREHQAKYPSGTFAQEREVIAIEALVRAHDRPAALQRAAAFRAAYPRSTHLERLAVVLAEP